MKAELLTQCTILTDIGHLKFLFLILVYVTQSYSELNTSQTGKHEGKHST